MGLHVNSECVYTDFCDFNFYILFLLCTTKNLTYSPPLCTNKNQSLAEQNFERVNKTHLNELTTV